MMEQTTEAAQYYWNHQIVASFGLGITCFLAGLALGAALWAGRKRKALRLEARNQELRRQIADIELAGEPAAAEPRSDAESETPPESELDPEPETTQGQP